MQFHSNANINQMLENSKLSDMVLLLSKASENDVSQCLKKFKNTKVQITGNDTQQTSCTQSKTQCIADHVNTLKTDKQVIDGSIHFLWFSI